MTIVAIPSHRPGDRSLRSAILSEAKDLVM